MKHQLLFGFLVASACAFGQGRGTISGELTDSSGASVPAAKVVISASAIGLTREVSSNESGFFTVPALPAADYDVKVEASGFKSLTRSAVRLDADAAIHLKLQLEVGQLTESVEVTSDAPLVETSNGEVSRLVTQDAIPSTCSASCPASSPATGTS